jgi:hypothetical protein
LGRLVQPAALHRGDQVQNSSARAAGEAVEDIPSQVHVEGFAPFAAVNWAAPPILIFAAAPKLYTIVPEH